jgi:hypothetical protein
MDHFTLISFSDDDDDDDNASPRGVTTRAAAVLDGGRNENPTAGATHKPNTSRAVANRVVVRLVLDFCIMLLYIGIYTTYSSFH